LPLFSRSISFFSVVKKAPRNPKNKISLIFLIILSDASRNLGISEVGLCSTEFGYSKLGSDWPPREVRPLLSFMTARSSLFPPSRSELGP